MKLFREDEKMREGETNLNKVNIGKEKGVWNFVVQEVNVKCKERRENDGKRNRKVGNLI